MARVVYTREVVTAIYDDFMLSELNVAHFERRVVSTRRWSQVLQIVVALFTGTTGVSAPVLFQQDHGAWIWGLLAFVATCVAVSLPILGLPKRLEAYVQAYSEFVMIRNDLKRVVRRLAAFRRLTPEDLVAHSQAADRIAEVSSRLIDTRSVEAVRKLQKHVQARHDLGRFWLPEKDHATFLADPAPKEEGEEAPEPAPRQEEGPQGEQLAETSAP